MFNIFKFFRKETINIGDVWVFKRQANPFMPVKRYLVVDMKSSKDTTWKHAVRVQDIEDPHSKYDFAESLFRMVMKPESK